MFAKTTFLLCFVSLCWIRSGLSLNQTQSINKKDIVYYDLKTGAPLVDKVLENERRPVERIIFRGMPCTCADFSCSCCVGVNIATLNFNRRACTNFAYDPLEFAIAMNVTMNDSNVYSNTFSAKNPPPMCLRLPYAPAINFCIRFYNIFTPGRNLHACIDFETRVSQSPVLVLHFNCVRVGVDGIAWLHPEDNGGLTPDTNSLPPLQYDDVDFESDDGLSILCANVTTLSPEEEETIGTLKL